MSDTPAKSDHPEDAVVRRNMRLVPTDSIGEWSGTQRFQLVATQEGVTLLLDAATGDVWEYVAIRGDVNVQSKLLKVRFALPSESRSDDESEGDA